MIDIRKMTDTRQIVEIRWHGRGGQGAVTSAEILAQAAIREGKYAQAFPSFGPERRGAPVVAFDRISRDRPIRARAGITNPDIVIVLDPGLPAVVNVASGLKEGGTVVMNSRKSILQIRADYNITARLAVIDATSVARELLGVPIVNTTMLGALLKATGAVEFDSLEEPIRERFGKLAEKNINAMRRAYEETLVEEV